MTSEKITYVDSDLEELDADTIVDIIKNMPDVASHDMIVNLLVNILALYEMDTLEIAPDVLSDILGIIIAVEKSEGMNPDMLH